MAGYTYPPSAPVIQGDFQTISTFLNAPAQVARRLQTLLDLRYIADVALPGRYEAKGGAVLIPGDEPLGAAEGPRVVAPLAEYPLTTFANGTPSLATTKKWGEDAEVSDESITRFNFDPVNRGLDRLATQNVITIDGLAMAAIASAVTQSRPAAAPWATATGAQIVGDVARARTTLVTQNRGFMPDLVLLDDVTYTNAWLALLNAGMLPRESAATLNTAPETGFGLLGMRWLPTPNAFPGTVVLEDSSRLGGMADEKIQSPGYVSASGDKTAGVEVKTMRMDTVDGWRIRARRVCVPVVLDPTAAIKITGV